MSETVEPTVRHARKSNVVKDLLPPSLRWNYRDTWLFTQSYYDDPEGVNLIGKLVATNKMVLPPTLIWAWCDVTLMNKTSGLANMAGRFAYWGAPVVAAASLFTVTTFAATRIRNKDDTWNYILGAFAAGGAIGIHQNCAFKGWAHGFAFAIAAVVKRLSLSEGWEIFPDVEHVPSSLRTYKTDYTIYTTSIPKGYDVVQK